MCDFRIGNGYDVHKLVKGRELHLGCVNIEYEFGLLGHSDADVLCHAIADSLLGACSEGDIGKHFPDNDDKYKGVSGEFILKETLSIIKSKGYSIQNIDSIIIAQKPKLAPYICEMKQNIANALDISIDRVNVKATTEEGLGFSGRGEGIAAHAVSLLYKQNIEK